MKRKIVGIFILCLVLGSLFYVCHTKKYSWANYAINSPTEDTVLHNIDSENGKFQESDTRDRFSVTHLSIRQLNKEYNRYK